MNANEEYDDILEFIDENMVSIHQLDKHLQTLYKFKFLFYTLKYKQQFRYLLWEKIRRPKIEAKYHPSNLQKMIDGGNDNDDVAELLEKW
jgi:hypothetical protein